MRRHGAVGLLATALLAGCGPEAAPLGRAGDVEVVSGFGFAPVGAEMAAYLTLRNRGASADSIVSFASPDAGTVMAHEQRANGGVVRMVMLASLPLPAGSLVAMAPGGLHLMLEGLPRPLVPGDSLSLTLVTARNGHTTVRIPVRAYGELP